MKEGHLVLGIGPNFDFALTMILYLFSGICLPQRKRWIWIVYLIWIIPSIHYIGIVCVMCSLCNLVFFFI